MIQSRRAGVAERLVEGDPAHAGECGDLPQLLRRVAAAVECPAVLGGEQGVDERLVAVDRQIARDHGGGERDLIEREVVEHPANGAGVDQVFLDIGEGAGGEGGTMGAGEGEVFADRYLGIGLADETFGFRVVGLGVRPCRRQREGGDSETGGHHGQ